MPSDNSRTRVALTGVLASALLGAAPAWALHWPWLHWPWKHPAAAQPQPVQELAINLQGTQTAFASAAAGAQTGGQASTSTPIQQYWDRNTLLLDLTRLSGAGGATLAPVAGSAWPVRLEFRVRPGGIARLEVTGAQRLIFTVPTQGDAVVLRLDPGVYRPDTEHLILRWSAAADLPH